jgi:hypothetical protein
LKTPQPVLPYSANTFQKFSRSRQKKEKKTNLGPLKDLNGLIDEVLALNSANSYLRKQIKLEEQPQEI